MACDFLYKGQSFTKQELEQYLNNHPKEVNEILTSLNSKEGIQYSFKAIDEDGHVYSFKNAKPLPESKPRTIKDGLIEGDIIYDGSDSRKVLGIAGQVYFMSDSNNFKELNTCGFTLHELIESGYELQNENSEEDTEEMTLAEVCKTLGKNIKIIK